MGQSNAHPRTKATSQTAFGLGKIYLHNNQLMNAQIARQFLANMPHDVFNSYIAPRIKDYGWPFDRNGFSVNRVEARRWFQMFDLQSVQKIRQLYWERREIPFPQAVFHPRSYQVVNMIIEHHGGIAYHAGIAKVADTRNKFFRARDYIARTGRMPVPVILQTDALGLRILDGNHRLAAMASSNNASDGIIDAWIGRH